MSLSISNQYYNGLTLKAQGSTVTIAGSIESSDGQEFMQVFFDRVEQAVIDKGLKKLTVDVTKLLFIDMNGIHAIVQWIRKLQSLPQEQQYKIIFRGNPYILWQFPALVMLSNFLPELLKVDFGQTKWQNLIENPYHVML